MEEKLTARLIGGSGGAAVKVTEIVLPQENWYGGEGMWAQIVEVPEASPFSKIDLLPSAAQLALLHSTAMQAENAEGIITVHAFGKKPEGDLTVQAALTEVVSV